MYTDSHPITAFIRVVNLFSQIDVDAENDDEV